MVRISPGVRRTEREDQVTHGDLGHGVRFHMSTAIYSTKKWSTFVAGILDMTLEGHKFRGPPLPP